MRSIGECDSWVAIILFGIIEMHFADLCTCTLFDQMCINFKLSSVLIKLLSLFFIPRIDIGLISGFEVYEFNGIILSFDQVNGTFQNIIILNERNINLGFLDQMPLVCIIISITKDLFQNGLLLLFA